VSATCGAGVAALLGAVVLEADTDGEAGPDTLAAAPDGTTTGSDAAGLVLARDATVPE
jgi:hypothetical protein